MNMSIYSQKIRVREVPLLLSPPGKTLTIKGKNTGPNKTCSTKMLLLTVRYILEIDSERERSAWVKRAEWGVLEEGAYKQR